MSKNLPTTVFPDLDPDARLGELLLYVAKKCQGDVYFGNTKLNKILFFSDFTSYRRSGRPLTGAEYVKQDFGPTPKRLVQVRNKLEEQHAAVIQKVEMMGKQQQRVVALRDPDLSAFSGAEIALVDEVIDYLKNKSAKECSDLSHNRVWRIAELGQSIPYQAFFVSDENASEADAKFAEELVREHGWAV